MPPSFFRTMAFFTALALCAAGCKGGGGGGGGAVDGEDRAPVAVLHASPQSGSAPLAVAYSASGSHDPEGATLEFSWDFGNGQRSSAPAGEVTYIEPGTYTIRLTVTDPARHAGAAEKQVAVGATQSFAQEVLHLTNLERRGVGLPPLKGNAILDGAASAHAADMSVNDFFDHVGSDLRTPAQRLTDAGYSWQVMGENIAAGYTTPADAVAGWMASAGHRANILGASFREIGVGYVYEGDDTFGPYRHYWVQDFGARAGVYPVVIEDEAYSTATRDVNLYVHGAGWATSMQVSEDPGFAGAAWQAFSTTLAWRLSEGAGLKQVYVRLRSGAETADASDWIYLE